MKMPAPGASQLKDLARRLGFDLTDSEAGEYGALLKPYIDMADA